MSASLVNGNITRAAQLLQSKNVRLLWDLTIYLSPPNADSLEVLLDIHERSCESRDRSWYVIPEILQWTLVHEPSLTESGRMAAARGDGRAWLEPLRQRLRAGRPFSLGFWDGRPFDDPEGSRSFSFQGVKGPDGKPCSFVRFLLPLTAPLDLMRYLATSVADQLPFVSAHGGLTFAYEPWNVDLAFDEIYAGARRFLGVDIEFLGVTLSEMDRYIKGVSWITMLGNVMATDDRVAPALAKLRGDGHSQIEFVELRHGSMFVAGALAGVGDRHSAATDLVPQVKLARALRPLMIDKAADFPGNRFAENGNTVGWLHRFVEPQGWT